jgi:malate dehydrogenase (oxaloacetate-decarboxylating)(NADP+)
MNIPVFHDDQHGTAIIVAAAVRNGLLVQGKRLEDVKLVNTGGGAAALACLDLLVEMGLKRENVTVCDIEGVVYKGRPASIPYKARYARETNARTLQDVLEGADVFLGLSAPRVLKGEWLSKLAPKPLVLALANPEPEILPEAVRACTPDAIVATGRSDYPNQVNNVLCFPFIFRGALDAGATTINEAMKVAAVEAIAAPGARRGERGGGRGLWRRGARLRAEYIIPKPFDPRLILEIAPAVAKAAMDSGVARRPIQDFVAYKADLSRFVYRSGNLMRPVQELAKSRPARIVFAEGEDERTLRAVQTVLDDEVALPVLIGRAAVVEAKVKAMGLRMDLAPVRPRAGPRPGYRGLRAAGGSLSRQGRPPRRAGR